MNSNFNRDSVSRSRMFVEMARQCDLAHRDEHEAFLDAAIVFARSALHRLQSAYKRKPTWSAWWSSLASDPSVQFLRYHRNFALQGAPAQVGQVVHAGGGESFAFDHYYFEHYTVPAVDTLTRHIDRIEEIVQDAETRFR